MFVIYTNGEKQRHNKKCAHIHPYNSEREWIEPGSSDYNALKKVVCNPALLKDLNQTNQFCHTSKFESYHNERLLYTPKRKHFPYGGMVTRTMIAIMDHNYNVKRDVTGSRLQYSKATKR